MGEPSETIRRQQGAITAQYDRIARFYRPLEPLFLIFPRARRGAVAALDLKPGSTVLEIGAGTGRNLPYLVQAVGPSGRVLALDFSPGMLAEAGKLVSREGWSNVELLHQDATRLEVDRELDAVLFSLSYSVIPEPAPALARAWERLRPGGRLAIMDGGLTETRLRPLLAPIAKLLAKLGPGDQYTKPWQDLAEYGTVETRKLGFGIYYVCAVTKRP
jgi:ubiquinone/menaquinone biosynthesis C-methylase UbiE